MAKSVKVYSTSTCPYCNMAKAFLKENNIPFEEVDVGQDRDAAQEMMEKSGQMSVPVIDVDGQIVIGFDKKALSKELGV
ncbi:MAG: glutathione S-transferase N-terminal domain-containing protein [Candidatus Hydrogenedentes bacterium]|nr:glutathione S-transferase N-terminal domain-containing protein [Candidatus Hydrogenedentota bacterium]